MNRAVHVRLPAGVGAAMPPIGTPLHLPVMSGYLSLQFSTIYPDKGPLPAKERRNSTAEIQTACVRANHQPGVHLVKQGRECVG